MLTGINDLCLDAFHTEVTDDNQWGIKEIQMFDKNILLEKGTSSFLATAFTGKSGKMLYNRSRKSLKTLEKKYSSILKTWDGNTLKLKKSKSILELILK